MEVFISYQKTKQVMLKEQNGCFLKGIELLDLKMKKCCLKLKKSLKEYLQTW